MSSSSFVKSTVILSVATLLSKILGSIFRIPLQNIAGDEVLGIFSMVYPIYMVALILSVAGIPIAISKLIAEARAEDNKDVIYYTYTTARILAFLFGITSFLVILAISDPLSRLLGGGEARFALITVSTTLLVAPYMAVYRGFFQGFEDMRPTAISQVIEQFIRVGFIIVIAYYLVRNNYSNDVIAGGVMVGSIAGAIASFIYLRIIHYRSALKLPKSLHFNFKKFLKYGRKILRISIPIAIGTITMALLNFIDALTIPIGLRQSGIPAGEINYLYGIYGRGLSLVQIATIFATSIVLPLIPLITKKLAENDVSGTRYTINETHRMTHIISWPAAAGLLALTWPLNLALFTNLEGSSVLAIIGFSSLFTSLTLIGTGTLQGMNLSQLGAVIIVVGVILKTFTNIVFIQLFGLNGAAVSTLIIYIVLFIANTFYIYKYVPFTIFSSETVKIIFSATVMGLVVGVPTLFFDFANWSRIQALAYIGVMALVGAVLYFLMLFMFKVMNKETLQRVPVIGSRIK